MYYRWILLLLVAAPAAGQGTAAGPMGLAQIPPALTDPDTPPQTWQTLKADKLPNLTSSAERPRTQVVEDAQETLSLGPGRQSRNENAPVDEARKPKQLSDFISLRLPADPVATVGAALAVVLGVFLLAAWVAKRSLPASQRPVPEEVATVIGRVPLAGKQMAQLVKVGPKLVLVALNPDGAKPLTEITDPVEVQRLLGLCQLNNTRGSSAAFEEIFSQLASEPAPRGFLGNEAPVIDRQRLADAYANTPGGRGRA